MSYLICEMCGKQYLLHEGEESFNYQNCSCGGKLEYSPNSKRVVENIRPIHQSATERRIKWKGIFIGLLFLFFSLIASVMLIFGQNIPTDISNIPTNFLTYFSVLTVILTLIAGSISSYLSGSKTYLDGLINGGMVGVILGLILGLVGGVVVFITGTIVFGLLSMAGGVIGILPRKLSKK